MKGKEKPNLSAAMRVLSSIFSRGKKGKRKGGGKIGLPRLVARRAVIAAAAIVATLSLVGEWVEGIHAKQYEASHEVAGKAH